MGASQSNISSNANDNKNGLEIIDIDLGDFVNSESEADTLNNVFQQLENITKVEDIEQAESSPFVSTEMFNKIMNKDSENVDTNSSSPFVNTEKFNKIMEGGNNDDSSSEKDIVDEFFHDEFDSASPETVLREISEIMVSSSDEPPKKSNKKGDKKKNVKYSTSSEGSEIKKYGFSETSSEIIKTSDDNYYINKSEGSSETPYNVESSEINTSDINLVSVDSRNGRRFI